MSRDRITARELFLNVMGFKSSIRTLRWELGYWGSTILRWYKEGLPKVKGISKKVKSGDSVVGPGVAVASPSTTGEFPLYDYDVGKYFKFDESFIHFPYNYWIYPRFEKKVIYEDDKYIKLFDTDGVKKKIIKDNTSMPLFLEWPVKNEKDWQKVKEQRFNIDSISNRYFYDIDNFVKEIENRTAPLGILDAPIGFFGSLRYLIGDTNLFMLFYDNPNFIKSICNYLCNFWLQMAEELTSKMEFDLACFWEDMSGKQGSLISPSMFREFLSPYYKRLVSYLKTKNIDYFLVDTDGKVSELIPLFLEAGVNMMYPFEQQAGNDLIEIRKKYPDLRILGGFDKNTLFKGKDFIDKELEKIEYLISKGGYIPFGDHLIPPNCSWQNFKYYRNSLNKIIDSTKVL